MNIVPAPAAATIRGIENMFEFVEDMPNLGDKISVETPDLNGIKSAVTPKSLLDVSKPEVQAPNESLPVSALTPTIQTPSGQKNITNTNDGGSL